jgi:hypothetical protein
LTWTLRKRLAGRLCAQNGPPSVPDAATKTYNSGGDFCRQAEHLAEADLAAVRVLEEYRRVAFADVRAFFEPDGNLKPMSQLEVEQGSALASLEVIVKNSRAGDGQTYEIHKIRLWDQLRALEALAKHFGLLTEKVDISGETTYTWLEGSA